MKMKTGIIFLVLCVLSIDCAPKSKHYLVKVRDNDDHSKMKVKDGNSKMKVEDILNGETIGQDDYSDRD